MAERNDNLRRYVLQQLESGKLLPKDKLPGARMLASQFGIVLPQAQSVLKSLMQDGVLESKARSGIYVQEHWRERIVSNTCATLFNESCYTYAREAILKQIPELYFATNMKNTVFEIKTTHRLLSQHADFIDLMPLFKECFHREDFFSQLLDPFIIEDKLCGIPIIFSPRLLMFNRDLLRKYGAAEPQEDWSWDDLLELIKYLRKFLPGENIFNWNAEIFQSINVIMSFGGELFSNTDSANVKFDSPETIAGLTKYAQLREALGLDTNDMLGMKKMKKIFMRGDMALSISPRQDISKPTIATSAKFERGAVSLPTVERGGHKNSAMAAELICVRKDCVDMAMIQKVVTTLLSPEVQTHMASLNYGIPFLKKAAYDKRFRLTGINQKFIEEIPNLKINYNIFSPEIYNLVCKGLRDIVLLPKDEIADATKQLANATRIFLKYL